MSVPELHIPGEAEEFIFRCACADPVCDRLGYQPEALPLIVACALRHLADELVDKGAGVAELSRSRARGLADAADHLCRRADELSGGPS